jgi:hypothetical protein
MIEHALQPGYDYGDEFEYSLDAIHDALEAGRGFCARSGQLTEIDLGVDVGELVARVSLGIQLGLAPASAGVPKAIGSSAPDTGLLESGSVDGSTSYS